MPIDNSCHSNLAVELAVNLAEKLDAGVTGLHVYAARLHDDRFRQMEHGLPSRYHEKGILEKQRSIHNTLIGHGLKTISNSYLDHFQNSCEEVTVVFERKVVEGKNYAEILREATGNGYDLVIMGILGLGAVQRSLIGSVCERVARKTRKDILVTKTGEPLRNKLSVAIDGSAYSMAALQTALELAHVLGAPLEVISVFDPHFHTRAFSSIAGVLPEEEGQSFRFKDQEKLHDEIINDGLAKIYRGYLEQASNIAAREEQEIESTLLAGKPFEEILNYVEKESPSLLVLGRFGAHRTDGLEMGSSTENLLRLAPCNILIVDQELRPLDQLTSNPHEPYPEKVRGGETDV